MAKEDRWSDNRNVEVRELRNAEAILRIPECVPRNRPLASRLRSKDSRTVLRGKDGKAFLYKEAARQPPTLRHVRFGLGPGEIPGILDASSTCAGLR